MSFEADQGRRSAPGLSSASIFVTMSRPPFLLLDIRPLCAARQAPLPVILDAVGRLEPGQDLVLVAPFAPAPLYELLARQGFSAAPRELGDGAWEITFHRE